jgi:TRAP-type C4-dicarboxylate transport system permease small subunit
VNRIASVLISIEKVLAKINLAIVAVCGVVWFLFMLMTVGDVTGRYLFLSPISGTTEIGQNVLAFAVFLCWAGVLSRNQHIRIFIVLDRLSPRWRYWFDILAYALGFSVIFPVAWYGVSFAITSIKLKEFYITYGIPLYPGKLALLIGAVLLALEFFIQLLIHIFSKPGSATIIAREQFNA